MQDFKWTRELINEFFDTFPEADLIQLAERMEQFKQSKSPKKDWEVVMFGEKVGNDINYYTLQEDGRYRNQAKCSTLTWPAHSFIKDNEFIHSVRRLSDGEIFSVGDRIQGFGTPVSAIEITNEFSGGLALRFSSPQSGCSIEAAQKLPSAILTTDDGKEVYDWKDFHPAIVFPDFDIKANASEDYWIEAKAGYPKSKLFSTREAAEKYIVENKPLLSLNDVKEVCNVPGMRASAQTDILIEILTALVKQKL